MALIDTVQTIIIFDGLFSCELAKNYNLRLNILVTSTGIMIVTQECMSVHFLYTELLDIVNKEFRLA